MWAMAYAIFYCCSYWISICGLVAGTGSLTNNIHHEYYNYQWTVIISEAQTAEGLHDHEFIKEK